MNSITRRNFLGKAGAISTWGMLAESASAQQSQGHPLAGGGMENSAFRLSLEPGDGLRNTRLLHVPSGIALADGDYSYSFGRPVFKDCQTTASPEGIRAVALSGVAMEGQLAIHHEFSLSPDQPWLEEQITLTNLGSNALDMTGGRGGFTLPLVMTQGGLSAPWSQFKLTAIPFRRDPGGHRTQYADFTLAQALTEPYSFERSGPAGHEMMVSPEYAAEAWAWTNGETGFLLLKYGQEGIVWSVVDRTSIASGQAALRWGGYGIHRWQPEHGAWLQPGESHRFGVTKLIAFKGGINEAYYTFREEMNGRGHGCPAGFDPPVHWNELYDNRLWWLPNDQQGDPEMRRKYYTLDDMKAEAAKAQAIGCEALYQDPGWDTRFASKIWDEARLGPYKAFTTMLQRDYGLKSSLHTPLSGWCDASSYPAEMYRMDRYGQRFAWDHRRGFNSSPLCGASRQYIDETARRLKTLARDGAAYFMFDGNGYHGECWDPQHGHTVPARREEHIQGMCRLARMIHQEYPQVLMEMHSPDPIYYGHGRAAADMEFSSALGFDSVWAFELMWQPMDDLLSGRSVALYYYNLAYGLPLYIHIDLRTDNANALVFWWNASTCRHLGIGGTHPDPQVQQAHKAAMKTYRRLKPDFAAGTFYGLDEMTHLHRHPTQSSAVINCFNLEDHAVERAVEIDPARYGLDPKSEYKVTGGESQSREGRYISKVVIPARGHTLLEIG
jgi:hypothetical protein